MALKNGAVIMICGSLSMQRDVLAVVDAVCSEHSNLDSAALTERGQILSDCY